MELEQSDISELIEEIPKFKLSYETVSHKKVSNYDVALAIPYGKKALCWFCCYRQKDVCLVFNINRNKEFTSCIMFEHNVESLAYNTLLYGTIYQEDNNSNNYFVIEDIYYYCGIDLFYYKMIEKWDLIYSICSETETMFSHHGFFITSPFVWKVNDNKNLNGVIPKELEKQIYYNIHHIQYRSNYTNEPFYNVKTQQLSLLKQVKKTKDIDVSLYLSKYYCEYKKNFRSPQYEKKTIFTVKADIQSDIYHLFAFGKQNKKEYYDVAYIPNYDISVKMNSIFRTVKENINIDNIEESDDEDDFQNIDPFKYVNTNIEVPMYFQYNKRFKKWIPLGIAPSHMKIIHIGRLVFYQ